ncbi:MAG: hypothetical protein V3R20_03730 [Sphingomonadales bacterium]
MFDNVINAAKAFFPNRLIMFAVSGLVAMLLYQLLGTGLDPMGMVKFAVMVSVGGLLASIAYGAASD